MADLSFGPVKNSHTPKPKTGQLVTLGTALFVLQARFTSPLDNAAKPLPRHRWALIGTKGGVQALAHMGTSSDSDGISSISATEDMNDPDMTWHLSWQPSFDDIADLQDWVATKEAWIDLDKKSNDTAAWVATRSLAPLEDRRLVRMPAWSSVTKAKNGKFNEVPNPGFDATGQLTSVDVVTKLASGDTFGTRTKPWHINVDFNWFRSFLHFRFFDFKTKDERIVPPGLLVRATTRDGKTIGGGTALDGEGTIYVLHEVTKESVTADMDYQFETPNNSIVDLDASAPAGPPPAAPGTDRRLVTSARVPDGATKRYLLPNAWSSSVKEAFLEGGSSRDRKSISKLRAEDTTLSRPLAFHLDDVVLFDGRKNQRVSLDKDSRVVLFDHRLAFRGPLDPELPTVLKEKISGDYLRAEDLIVRKGEAFPDSTFVIHHEGDYFVLREKRLTGPMGKTPKLGARLAEARAPENPIGDFLAGYPKLKLSSGGCELHFLPDAYDGPYDEAREGKFFKDHPDAKICHLLVTVPVTVVAAEVGNKNDFDAPTEADVVKPENLKPIVQALLDAAERWDQAHPAHGATGKKDYVALPASGPRVVKLRHYFPVRRDGGQKVTIHAAYKNKGLGERSFASDDMSLILSPRPPNQPQFVNRSIVGSDSDKVTLPLFTLAHEMGHEMGLPDEYMESVDFSEAIPEAAFSPRIVRFGQAQKAYPFKPDIDSMMHSDLLPRLRHLWHHLDAFLNEPKNGELFPEAPYVLQYPEFALGATYRIADGNITTPWEPIVPDPAPMGRSPLVLYRTGDDEATLERVYPRPAGIRTPGAWLQGILVVTPKIWFNFLASRAGDFDDNEERFKIMAELHRRLFTPRFALKQRFMIETVASQRLARIGILFQPRMEFGRIPQPASAFGGAKAEEKDADVVIDVVFQNSDIARPAIRPPGFSPSNKPRLQISSREAGLAILRFALGIPPGPVPNNGPLTALELQPLANSVSVALADPLGSPPRITRDMPS